MLSTLRICSKTRLPPASFLGRNIGYGYNNKLSSCRFIAHISRTTTTNQRNWSPFFIAVIAASGILGGSSVIFAEVRQDRLDSNSKSEETKKKIVVLGSGWAGISFLKTLDTNLYDVHVISPRNFFVFTPLLPSVTAGTVEARSITEPIRRITENRQNIKFSQANCISIDSVNRKVLCRPVANQVEIGKTEFEINYDYLIVAVGAQPNTFNTPGVEDYCHFLKEIEDAERIRESIMDFFELAALPFVSEDERRQLLQFVIIGGGPTGVEFAAELHDLIYEDLCKLYPNLMPFVNIVVIQSGDHILNMFDVRISDFAEKKFKRDGIDVRTGCRVLAVQKNVIVTKEKKSGKTVEVPYGMAIWSTGIGTRPVIANFMKQIGQDDRRVLATDEWLRVKGCDNAYALGDCATIEQRKLLEDVAFIFKLADVDNSGTLTAKEFRDAIELLRSRYPQIDIYLQRQHMKDVLRIIDNKTGSDDKSEVLLDIEEFKKSLVKVDSQMKALPATAQVAAQQGEYLAKCFNRKKECEVKPEGPLRVRGEGRHLFRPFEYKHLGQFAPLGGEQAAAELPGDWVSLGRSTQWLWYSVYASKQVSWRTRALVIFDWTKRFVFGRDSSRM